MVETTHGADGVRKLFDEWVKPDINSQRLAVELCGGLDLAFVIDVTGSMIDDIDAVKSAATAIINSVFDTVGLARVSIVLYKDHGDNFVTRTHLPFTTDSTVAVNGINSIPQPDGGGDFPEAAYSGLVHAIENQSGMGEWRVPDGSTIIILMGDAPPKDPKPVTGFTAAIVAQKAFDADPVTINTIAIGSDPSTLSTFGDIATGNRGAFFNALNANEVVDTVFEAIDEAIDQSGEGEDEPPQKTFVELVRSRSTRDPYALRRSINLRR